MNETNKVGIRLAALRAERSLSVEELAARCGMPEKEVKAIEAGELSPTIASLVKLSRTLSVRVGTFLDDADFKGPVLCRKGHADEVMRAPGRDSPNSGTLSFRSLAKGKAGRSMEPFVVEVRPGVEKALSIHEGEEFIYVLEGEIELHYGNDVHKLGPGDSIYYDSVVPHLVSSSAPAKIVAVLYAPF
jgi:quercetin dioxygenase-like cupin family protein/DNA-binding XRE family transcriptional regulator